MIADQFRRDKDIILDNEAGINATMENDKGENSDLAKTNYQLPSRVAESGTRSPAHKLRSSLRSWS